MSDRTEDDEAPPRESLGEIVRTVIYALLIALAFRTVLYQPFSIPSGSMKPNLLIGDYLFVSKFSYGYSRFSVPFGRLIPEGVWGGRLLSGEPERGDVIVFRNPKRVEEDYIKRVVGMPGDRIQMRSGVLHINGDAVPLAPDGRFLEDRGGDQRCLEDSGLNCAKERLIETLPGGVTHSVLDAGLNLGADNTCVYTVPPGHYFFLGDNRDNSLDSRFGADPSFVECAGGFPPRDGGIGFVPADLLIGRAEFVLMSSEGAFYEFWNWRADRFFKAIE